MNKAINVRRPYRRGGELLARAAIHGALLLALATVLAPAELGLFAAALGAMLTLGRLAVFGADTEVSRLLRRLERRRGREQLVLAGQAAVLRFSAGVLGLGVFSAAALEILGGPPGAPSIAVSIALGAVGAALFDYGTAPRPGHLGHPSAALQRLGMPLSRLALTVGLCVLIPGRADLALLAFASATLMFGLPPFLRTERKLGTLGDATLVTRLVKRTQWRGLEDTAGVLSLHTGTLLLVAVGQPEQAAVFALALGLALLLRAALHPDERSLRIRAARRPKGGGIQRLLARSMVSGLGLALLGIPALVALGWWLPQLLPAYETLPVPLWLLAGSAALLVVEAPALVAARALGRPQLGTLARGVRLGLVVLLGTLWIPGAGATGAALALATATAASTALLFALAAVPAAPRPQRPSRA